MSSEAAERIGLICLWLVGLMLYIEGTRRR